MINNYLNFVSKKSSQIILFILFNLCGLTFILLPYGIVWNMLDLHFSYTSADVFKSFYQMGEKGRYVYLYSTLIIDTFYPILYTSILLGALSDFGSICLNLHSFSKRASIEFVTFSISAEDELDC